MKAVLLERFRWYQKRASELGGVSMKLIFSPPASLLAIKEAERRLGYPIPKAYRDFLSGVSSRIEFFWSLFNDAGEVVLELPQPLAPLIGGRLIMGLGHTLYYERLRQRALNQAKHSFERAFYQNKLLFDGVEGNFIAIDLEKEHYGRVVFLGKRFDSPYILAATFESYIDNYTALGCVGTEAIFWAPFTNFYQTPLDKTSQNAKLWLHCIGRY